MEYRIYLGPAQTGGDHLLKLIDRNNGLLKNEGILCVPPEKSNRIWSEIRTAHRDDADRPAVLERFHTLCLDGVPERDVDQLVFWLPSIKERIVNVARASDLLPRVRFITRVFTAFLPRDQLILTAAVRNPAKFIVGNYIEFIRRGGTASFDDFIVEMRPDQMHWSRTWERLLVPYGRLHPDDAPLYIWRYEDYPMNWREVLSAVTGCQDVEHFIDIESEPTGDMSLYGAALMQHYLVEKPVEDDTEREQIYQRFLADYPDDGTIIRNRTWTTDLVAQMFQSYEDDWYFLEQMDHVITL